MSNEAARILRRMNKNSAGAGNTPMLGTVIKVNPIELQLDDVSFTITSGVLVNEGMISRSEGGSLEGNASFSGESGRISISGLGYSFNGRLKAGDRVLVNMINESCFVIVCKVQKA